VKKKQGNLRDEELTVYGFFWGGGAKGEELLVALYHAFLVF
jgi:hypothetical protein